MRWISALSSCSSLGVRVDVARRRLRAMRIISWRYSLHVYLFEAIFCVYNSPCVKELNIIWDRKSSQRVKKETNGGARHRETQGP
ncbi:hypothetical protein HRM2_19600 [Desulforapulum autotrophicum HRM2]|uniref:Uncharacterized protein n=1 Tax=Desulforapulum autotrophicum (strain ATCC 43914 / DSM 3382 / VKM B-1955 / HRM2) TaxID=177437 RepID=C0QCI4_DESAH|nr:hypothetical protein HRM2_19600 [Desulforapulum autotrophicum HRM2]